MRINGLRKQLKSQIISSTFAKSIMILNRADRLKIIGVIFIQLFLAILDLVGIAIVGVLGALAVSGVQGQQPGNRVSFALKIIALEDNSLQFQFAVLGVIACLMLVGKTFFSVIFSRRILFFLSSRGAEVSGRLTSQLLRQSLLVIQSKSQQSLLNSLTSGVSIVMLGLVGATVNIISDVVLLVLLSFGLFLVDPIVATSTMFGFVFIAYILYKLLHDRTRTLGAESTELVIKSNEQVVEVLSSYREAVVKNRREHYARNIYHTRQSLAGINAEMAFIPSISKYVIESSLVIGTLLLGATQFALQDARHAVGILAVFMAASARIAPAVLRVQTGILQIKGSMGTAAGTLELINEIGLADIPRRDLNQGVFEYSGFSPNIDLQKIHFAYPGNLKEVITGLTLKIRSGESVALVGSSGAGKTTLADLILGVLDPSSGTVLISGETPSKATTRWPGAISYVPQDVLVINSTIRGNVILGYEEGTIRDSDIWAALRIAQLEDFVRELPEGLDTFVGERGTRISGGQRQRLGIARAMFTKPRLLVMDEATSSLDGQTESDLSEAISRLKGDVTVVLIAHRLSTIRSVDTVIYLENGTIKASGPFEEVRRKVPDFDRQAELMGL